MPKPDVPLRQYAWVVKLRPGGRRVVRRAGRNGAEPRRRRLFGRGVGHSYQCPALTACDLDTQPGRPCACQSTARGGPSKTSTPAGCRPRSAGLWGTKVLHRRHLVVEGMGDQGRVGTNHP